MKFITLTETGGAPLLINPMMIQAIQRSTFAKAKSMIYVMEGTSWLVMESADEILELIRKSENITTVTWKTGATPHI